MKIRDLFGHKKPLFSFEFFPPKTDAGMTNLEKAVRELGELGPAYVSVTYGAGGSTRERTVGLVTRIQNEMGICAMAHFTCVGSGRVEMAEVLERLVDAGIENLIALRGRSPGGRRDVRAAARWLRPRVGPDRVHSGPVWRSGLRGGRRISRRPHRMP